MPFQINPTLAQFLTGFATDAGKDFGAEAVARVQRHLDAAQVAATTQRAHEEFVGKMSALKDNLVGMARNDPTTHDLALDLADISMRGMTSALGHSDEAHNALLGHLQGEIAHAAIQGMAGYNEGAARAALTSGRLAALIPDDQRSSLDAYITNMANQRQVDGDARQAEIARQHILGSNKAAGEWLSGLTDPSTGQLWFPDNYGQRMTADDRLSPVDKAGLQNAYRNLLQNGNPSQSDPSLVHSLLQRAALPHNDPDNPSVGEVVSHAGRGLTLSDAQFIAGRTGPQPPDADLATSRIADVMTQARQDIGNDSAFGRFTNWLIPAMKQGANLDPNSKDYLLTLERMAAFQPTGDDIVKPAVQAQPADTPRPSLGEIFGS